jgi:hypothetical protein
MKARAMTAAEREAQIVALWKGRPRQRRTSEDVVPFYNWLVDYAPWLVPRSSVSVDQVSALVEAHTTSADEAGDLARKSRRPRLPERD